MYFILGKPYCYKEIRPKIARERVDKLVGEAEVIITLVDKELLVFKRMNSNVTLEVLS